MLRLHHHIPASIIVYDLTMLYVCCMVRASVIICLSLGPKVWLLSAESVIRRSLKLDARLSDKQESGLRLRQKADAKARLSDLMLSGLPP